MTWLIIGGTLGFALWGAWWVLNDSGDWEDEERKDS